MKTLVAALMLMLPFFGNAQTWRAFSMSDSNPETGFQGTKECCSVSFQAENSIKRFGKTSLRVELNKSDPSPTDGSGSKRAEKYYNYGSTKTAQNANLRWYAFSMFSPAATNASDPAEEIRFQLHSNVGSPVCALELKSGTWRIARRNSSGVTYTNIAPINLDVWEDWVFYFDESQGTDGSIKVWRNDVLLYTFNGTTNYSNSTAIYPYPNIGIYKWPWSGTWNPASTTTKRVFYVDSVFYGTSAATYENMDVTPTGSTPPPTNVNQAPTSNAGTDLVITLPTNSATLNGSKSTDGDGTIASYKWSQASGPSTAVLTNASSSTATASGLLAGTYVFRLTVTDNNGATGTDDITVTVVQSTSVGNQAPVANAGTNKTLTLPTNSTTLSASASKDPDGSITAYRWTQTSGPSSSTLTNASTVNLTVGGLIQGTYTYRVTVTDNLGATGTATVSVTVNAATTTNKAPTANAGSARTITLPTNSVSLSGSASTDSDGTITSYRWSQVSGPNTATLTNATSVTATASNLIQGTYSFRLTVTDNGGASSSATVSVTVNAAATTNQAPVANAGSAKTITLPSNSISLIGSASTDSDGTIASYRWTQVSGPNTATLTNATYATATASNLIQGTYSFRLTVTDNDGASGSATVSITVNAAATSSTNKAPVANAGSNKSIRLPTSSVSLSGAASFDPDGNIKAYKWTQTCGPSTVTFSSTMYPNITVYKLKEGTYCFKLQVWDYSGATASATVSVIVYPALASVKQAPVAITSGKQTVVEGTAGILTGKGSYDPDGVISTYSWIQESGPSTATIADPTADSTTVANLKPGTYNFQLIVTDNDGLTGTATHIIEVIAAPEAPNAAPIIVLPDTIMVDAQYDTVRLDASNSYDTDGQVLKYQWKLVNGPANTIIGNPNAAATTVSKLKPGAVYIFQVIAVDNDGASSKKELTVTVASRNSNDAVTVMSTYPNPTRSTFTLRLDDNVTGQGSVNIYNMSGVIVYQDRLVKNSTSLIKSYNISDFKAGTYIVYVKFEDAPMVTRKIQKL